MLRVEQGDIMSGQQGYDHIKVTPSEADEEVIVAGRPSVSANDREISANVRPQCVADEPVSQSSQMQTQAQKDRLPDGSADRYQATTIEDIDGFKMSTMQKVIIVIAILLVIAFIVYMITG